MARKAARPRLSALDRHMLRLQQRRSKTLDSLGRHVRDLPCAALVTNAEGAYVLINAAATRLTGYSPDDMRSMSVWDLTAELERDTDVLWRMFVKVGIQRGTITLRKKNGTLVRARYVAHARLLPGHRVALLKKL